MSFTVDMLTSDRYQVYQSENEVRQYHRSKTLRLRTVIRAIDHTSTAMVGTSPYIIHPTLGRVGSLGRLRTIRGLMVLDVEPD